MPLIYRVRVGGWGRIVLPGELREAYGMGRGDEVVIIARGRK
jgi:bifunctional DNA-binding transcriptional regulator/antitoxin component of YhaV-PrlF toxin-antitoxin module